MADPKVYVFIDNSNVFISAKEAAEKREGNSARFEVRLNFENLARLAISGRQIGKVAVVGSIPPPDKTMWSRLEAAMGIAPELYEHGSLSGGEQGLDQCLQVHMLRAISDNAEPQIAVLMTGDGAGYDDGVGFYADLERMHAAGWGIEVISWRRNCKRTLREWAEKAGTFIALDDYYDSITFLEGGRASVPIDTKIRTVSSIGRTPLQIAEEKMRKEMEAKVKEIEKAASERLEEQKEKFRKKTNYEKKVGKRK